MTGLSEQEIIEIINRISSRLGPKFRFGYHTNEDMRQQASLFAWEGMGAWVVEADGAQLCKKKRLSPGVS